MIDTIFSVGGLIVYCPFCANDETKVLESRLLDTSMRRRRECLTCSNRFTTYETAEFNLKVLKRQGKEEDFSLQKVSRSFEKACGKIDASTLIQLSNKVQQKILQRKQSSIKSSEIGKFVLQELKFFDKIAYVRFVSIHKSIEDPKLLQKELQTVV